MSEFKELPLREIKPDPNQPRKFIDEVSLGELIESVREKGVIQPILVRPHGKGYKIVCGERRYQAALAVSGAIKDRNTIPAIIREMSDAEALDLQIIENLQRKDVNPMEEAVAFKRLLDMGKTAEEIGIRLGKNTFFVRQRLALTNLTDNWQRVVFFGHVPLKMAMKISRLTAVNQEKLYEAEVDAQRVSNPHYELNIHDRDIKEYTGTLSEAPFDIADKELNPERGSCNTCPFNTNYAVLFSDGESARCTDIDCYQLKCNRSFELRLAAFNEEPGALFVSTTYRDEEKEIKALNKRGISILERSSYEKLTAPELPDRDEWMYRNADDFDTAEDVENGWKSDLEDYEEELKEYQKAIASGKYKKALVVIGDDKGAFIYVKLRKGTAAATKTAAASGESETAVTAEDIDDEISRINEREKRAKELDDQKVWADVYGHLRPEPNIQMLKGSELTSIERVAIARTIDNVLGWSRSDDFKKHFKIKDFSKVTEISFSQLNEMLRFFFLDKLPPSPTTLYKGHTDDSTFCMQVAKAYFPSVVEDIEAKHAEKIEKRVKRVAARIAELKKQKKELQPAKPKAAKKK